MREAILEPLLRKMRIARVLPLLKNIPGCRLLDVGCGWEARFLRDAEPYISTGVGMDFKAPELRSPKLTALRATLEDSLPFPANSFDAVTMLAVLEHLEKPGAIVKEILRVLRPGGVFVGTVPSKAAKPVLEFLSYRLHIVNEQEIRDHKRYFDKDALTELFLECGFTDIEHSYFQLGMNNFFIAQKPRLHSGGNACKDRSVKD